MPMPTRVSGKMMSIINCTDEDKLEQQLDIENNSSARPTPPLPDPSSETNELISAIQTLLECTDIPPASPII
ncbi:hypothetical protein PGTUg99_004076 [Puccinia graminis f. sp. tritici]|uniref:Uncharacterized protein n=1 Tax=Puccinia graminis f. sp. tritici TaxID=56615 RepID=A0A5B0S4W9_PUCGR|nr:hypothetical protein PGTUg99_004076 [Puccinia graminis f. sp. tritici]